jgi:hypothetical protein
MQGPPQAVCHASRSEYKLLKVKQMLKGNFILNG